MCRDINVGWILIRYVYVCVFICVYVGIELFRGISYVFTVWYICTPVACDSRYTLSTIRKLTPTTVTVLSRGLSIVIIILPAFSPFRKIFLFTIASFMCIDK